MKGGEAGTARGQRTAGRHPEAMSREIRRFTGGLRKGNKGKK